MISFALYVQEQTNSQGLSGLAICIHSLMLASWYRLTMPHREHQGNNYGITQPHSR